MLNGATSKRHTCRNKHQVQRYGGESQQASSQRWSWSYQLH